MIPKFNLVADKLQGDRDEQQDAYFVEASKDGQRILCVIADGMGGHSGGRKASACVVVAAKNSWQKMVAEKQQSLSSPEKILENIIQQAYEMMQVYEKKESISPRSTCVMLFINNDIAHYCHLGDSRLYHFRKQKLLTRTKDHSVVQMLVEMGKVSESDMGTHEDQGRLLKWIGGEETPQATFHSVEIEAGDQFLLCSDGLWEYVSVKQMEEALQSNTSDKHIVKRFAHQARHKSKGKGDNIALILCSTPGETKILHWHFVGIGIIAIIVFLLAFYYFNTIGYP